MAQTTAQPIMADFHWHKTYHLGQLDILQAYIKSQRRG